MDAEIKTTTEGPIAGVLTLPKQIRFAAASAATATVKEAQREVIETIQETFITRSPWFEPSNRFGIHFKPATLDDPSAEIKTAAYWLVPHELGATKEASDGEFLAVPTAAVQPDIRQQIPLNLRPRNIAGAFVIKTARGPKIVQRVGRQLRTLYHLVEKVQVRKRSTVIEPTVRTFQTRFLPNFAQRLAEAMRTAKL